MGYKKPFILPKVTATCNILNQTPMYSTSHRASRGVNNLLCSQNMSTNGSPTKRANMATPGGWFGFRQLSDDNSGSSDDGSWTSTENEYQSGRLTNKYHPPHGYGYPPSQQPFPGALQFYRNSPFNMTPNSLQPATRISQQFPSKGPLWQGYDLHQGGYGVSEMVLTQWSAEQGLSYLGAPRVPRDGGETIQPIGQHLPAQLFHLDLLSARPGHSRLAFLRTACSRLQKCGNQMPQGVRTCRHHRRYLRTNIMRMMWQTIDWTWAVQRANPQFAWSKPKSPSSNLPKGWGRPTAVCSTRGREYGWLGFSSNSVCPESWGRTIWYSFEMDRCTGRKQLQITLQHARTCKHWINWIILNGFLGSGWRCFCSHVQVKFGRQGNSEGKGSNDHGQIWENTRPNKRKVTSQPRWIQHSQ